MSANLYHMSGDRAVGMNEYQYDSENTLQKIIANNPSLLLRDTDPDDSRLMLIDKEFEVAEGDDSSISYFLDHLLVDQNGVPVLVEVKRSTNTQIRREVVAQMLDYASRVSTWDANDLRRLFQESNHANEELLEMYDSDTFWEQVANCLKAERVKLVFAADRIPSTLKTLIEFMDRNMEGIEVYGVELRQYKTEEATMLISNVVGETSIKSLKSTPCTSVEWTAAKFSSYLFAREKSDLFPVFEDLCDYAHNLGLVCSSGHGPQVPSFKFKLGNHSIFKVMGWWKKSAGNICTVEICIRDLLLYPPGKSWGEDVLRKLFSNMPEKNKAESSGLMWHTRDLLYIELRVLLEERNLTYFKTAVKTMRDAIIQCEQGNSPSPPCVLTLLQDS